MCFENPIEREFEIASAPFLFALMSILLSRMYCLYYQGIDDRCSRSKVLETVEIFVGLSKRTCLDPTSVAQNVNSAHSAAYRQPQHQWPGEMYRGSHELTLYANCWVLTYLCILIYLHARIQQATDV